MRYICHAINAGVIVLTFALLISPATATMIDPGVPPGGNPSQPLALPIPYQFMTSSDNIQWTAEQKDSARNAIANLGSYFLDQPAFHEMGSPDDFTMRWAGSDLFKNWGDYNGDVWDYSTALAFAVKPRPDNSTPWSQVTYPYNEIYFNTSVAWHYNPFTMPSSSEYDFWAVTIHEVIHMLCVDDHSTDPNEVMYAYFEMGERRTIQPSDLEMLRKVGYNMVPEIDPATGSSALSLVAGVLAMIEQRRRKAVSTALAA